MSGAESSIPLGEIIGIAACVIGSAFFSGSETALTRITSTRATLLIDRSPGKYGILRLWLDARKRILAMLLIGNNLVNIFCSILAYRVAVRFFPSYAEAISVFGLTLMILIFAEVTPKSLALQNAERLAVPVLRVVWLLDKLLFPLAWPLSRIPGLLQSDDEADDGEPVATEDEIEFHIRRGVDKAVFEKKEQGELLISAMEFSDIMTKEVMVPRTDMVGLDQNTGTVEALDRVIESGHSRLPVYDDTPDKILGVIYAKDLLRHIHSKGERADMPVSNIMRPEVMFVPETLKISALLSDMRQRGLHLAAVVDEFGGTAGLVTLEDIIEELVGEIRDEFDPEEPLIRRLDDNRWQVDARLSIHDLETETGIVLPDTGDYESVGGFVVAEHGRIPRRGRIVNAGDIDLIVTDSDARHVKKLEIRQADEAEPDQTDK